MAYADYTHCAVCDIKCFYDAEIEYEESRTSTWYALCDDCGKDYRLVLQHKKTGKIIKPKNIFCEENQD